MGLNETPRHYQLFLPTLQALEALGGSASIEEIDDRVAGIAQVSEAGRAALHKNGPITEFDYRSAWSRSWLKNAGLVENSARGVWALTGEGRLMLDARADELIRIVRRANAEKRKSVAAGRTDTIETEQEEAGEEVAAARDWREQLLDILLRLDPSGFERLCQRLLRESGFTKVVVTGKSGDGGIDGTGVLRLNLLSFHVLFQCKRWQGSVGPSPVRDFRGAMVGRADKGLIITTGTFTADARREATRDGAPAIDLIDGEGLCDLLKDRGIGVQVRMVEEVTVDQGAFEAF